MKKKLLLVENTDSFTSLTNVRTIVAEQYELLRSHSGKEAMQILKREHVDVVLLDLVLQDMDGVDLLKMIRMEFGRTLPVMIEDDHGNLAGVIEALRYGAYDIVRKDITYEYLDAMINKVLECRDLQVSKQTQQSQQTQKKGDHAVEGVGNSEGSYDTFVEEGTLLDYKQADRRFKKRYFGHLLKLMNGNISKAAGKAGITRQGLHKILNGLKKEEV